MTRSTFLALTLALSSFLSGCAASGSVVIHCFDRETGDPAGQIEVRLEEANLSRRGKDSVRFDDVPCRPDPYMVHVSSPRGYFPAAFQKIAVQDGAVVSLEVQVELNAEGKEAKERAARNPVNQVLQGVDDVLGR